MQPTCLSRQRRWSAGWEGRNGRSSSLSPGPAGGRLRAPAQTLAAGRQPLDQMRVGRPLQIASDDDREKGDLSLRRGEEGRQSLVAGGQRRATRRPSSVECTRQRAGQPARRRKATGPIEKPHKQGVFCRDAGASASVPWTRRPGSVQSLAQRGGAGQQQARVGSARGRWRRSTTTHCEASQRARPRTHG